MLISENSWYYLECQKMKPINLGKILDIYLLLITVSLWRKFCTNCTYIEIHIENRLVGKNALKEKIPRQILIRIENSYPFEDITFQTISTVLPFIHQSAYTVSDMPCTRKFNFRHAKPTTGF